MAFYGLSKLPFASPQTLRNSPNAPNAPKTRQTLQTPSAQQAPQGQGHFPNRHPRAKATSPTGTPRPGHSNGFLWAFKAAVCQPANAPKLSKPSKCSQNPPNPPNTVLPTGTPWPRPLPQQAPQGQATAMAFYGLSKLPFASPQTLRISSNAPNASKTRQTLQTPSAQQAPQGQGHFPNRHPRAKATSRTGTPRPGHSNGFLWAFKAAVCQPANAPKLSKPSKCSQNPPNPPNTVLPTGTPWPRPLPQQAPQGQGHFPNRHPKARPQQWLSIGFQSCRLPARKRSETLQTLQMLPKPAKPSKHRPPNRHPRAQATSPTGTPGPGHSNGFLWAFKAAVCQPANAPKLSKRSKCSQNPPNPPNTVRPTGTPGPRPLPQQAPQGQGHFPNRHPKARPQQWLSMGFQSCRLPARKRSETLQTLQMLPKPAKPSKHRPPNRHPRAKATSPTGTPGPGHSNGFLWAFKAAVCQPANAPNLFKRSKCFQNPPNPPNTVRPTGTPGPRPLPQQAPQGQATAMAFYGLSKLPFASPQTLRNSPNPPNAPKTRQTFQTPSPQQAPQGQGHFPNRHPRARSQQWLSMGFQSCRLPARKRSETLQTLQMLPKPAKPSKHRPQQAPQIHSNDLLKLSKLPFASLQRLQPHLPQQAPQGQGHFPNRHPRAKATSRTGTPRPGHSNGFLWAFKAAVCQPANAPKLSKPSKCSQNPPNPPNTVLPTGTPGPRPLPQQAPQGQGHFPNRHPKARPQQWLSMGFQSCRLPARKRSETLQTLQMLPKPAKPSKHRPPNRHPRAQATSPTGTPGPGHSNGFLWAFKAAVCQPANAPKLSKRSKCSQNPPNPPNTVPSRPPRSTAMTFLRLSKLPFASLQRLQPHLPQQAPLLPNRHPRAKATSPTGTPRPSHSNGFLWAFKAAVCQPANAPNPRPGHSNGFLWPFKAAVCQPAKAATPRSPTGTPDPGHGNGFLWAFKAAVCQPANAPKLSKRSKCSQNPPNPPNTVRPTGTPGPRPLPQQAPQGQGHFPNRHPKARPQQWLSMGFQSCRLPARKRSETLQTLQMLPKPAKPSKHRPPNRHPRAKATSPTGTPGPRPLPQQAPQGQATAMAFYGLSKLPFASPQTLRNSPNPPNAPKTRQTLQTPSPQQAPQGPGHFPNRHPRARPQQWLSMGFQSCRLPARKRSETLQTLQMLPKPAKPSKHRPQQAPQIHSNDFLEAFKAAVCQPAKAATPPSPTGTPVAQQAPQGQGHFPNRHPKAKPQQWLSMGFQSCRLPARKRSKPKARPQQWLSMAFQSCRLPARKSCNPTFPNRHPRPRPRQWLINGIEWEFLIFTVDPSKCGLFM